MRLSATWVLLLIFGLFSSCENDLEKVERISQLSSGIPVETSRDIEILFSDSALVRARLISPLFLTFKTSKPYQVAPIGLEIQFLSKEKEIVSNLTAKYGKRSQWERLVEVRDSVVVINTQNEKLETEQLTWDEQKKIIYTDKFVKITTADKILQGYGLEANEDFSKYKILRLSGVISLKE